MLKKSAFTASVAGSRLATVAGNNQHFHRKHYVSGESTASPGRALRLWGEHRVSGESIASLGRASRLWREHRFSGETHCVSRESTMSP